MDKVSLRKMLANRHKCQICLGKGYVLTIVPQYNAKVYRVAIPCPKCVKQVVTVERKL